MAFRPRPTMIPGMTVVGPPFLTAGLMPAMTIPIPAGMPSLPPPMGMRPHPRMNIINPPLPPPQINRPPVMYQKRPDAQGPAVTVFVGNITERAPDTMMRHILNACGTVISWKRVQGASGKLQAFGFCEFGNPDAALRAIRLLHEYEIADKKLVVKADAKTKEVLDDYKEKRKKAQQNGDGSPLQDEQGGGDEDSYMDGGMRQDDDVAMQRISHILRDHNKDIVNWVPPPNRQDMRDRRITWVKDKLASMSSDLAGIPSEANLDDMEDVEEEKKELISREILMFREQMKKLEVEKERDRKIKEKDRGDRGDRERGDRGDRERGDKDRDRDRERDREREREREFEKERERERERREREEKLRRRSRSSSRPPARARSGSPDRRRGNRSHEARSRSPTSPSSRKAPKDIDQKLRVREIEAEEKERKEQEKKIRKKEMQYQERLRNWELRENKKQKELEREREKERMKEMEREKEAKRLKEFLEDYEDDRDDHKYYKGYNFQRRLTERESEKEGDLRDRAKEKEELEELRSKIIAEGHDNPDAAFQRACQEREERYKPKLLLRSDTRRPFVPTITHEDISQDSPEEPPEQPPSVPPPQPDESEQSDSDDSDRMALPEPEPMDSPPMAAELEPSPPRLLPQPLDLQHINSAAPKRKKMDVRDVFNQDDDEDGGAKKKKLSLPIGKDKGKEKGGEEKRKHIKNMIDKIPTSKEELFSFPIDASMVDNVLMEKRIRPWINKKIVEYIGEPEPTLVEFICSKILVGSDPESLLNDVQMVLDDEAEVFVVKMWRLLIYEIESKRLGVASKS